MASIVKPLEEQMMTPCSREIDLFKAIFPGSGTVLYEVSIQP